MERTLALAVTVAVWVANVGVTALAVYGLEHPKPYTPGPDVWQPSPERPMRRADATRAAAAEPSAIEMPMVTIAAGRRGAAEMQRAPDVVIGPGTVTHP